MTEFRRLACCSPRRPWNRTKSFSQLNKSYVLREDDDGKDQIESPPSHEPLLREGEPTTVTSEPPSIHMWCRGESIRFRTYGGEFAQLTSSRGGHRGDLRPSLVDPSGQQKAFADFDFPSRMIPP
uniref:Uncharacterized protein n=1 Tax=Heterorhabditis bacteriophora TaxID=37862 RepID=A0A1I7XLV1_HETBA